MDEPGKESRRLPSPSGSNASSYDTATTHTESGRASEAFAAKISSQEDSSVTPTNHERDGEVFVSSDGHDKGWRRTVRNFTPQFYTITMGTGVVAVLINQLPYNGSWLYWLSVAFFALTAFLWLVFLLISILRLLLYPHSWAANLRHPSQTVFLAAIPTGLSTIINMIIYVCVPTYGSRAALAAWGLWWVDVAGSVLSCLYLPYRIMLQPDIHLSSIEATWLLPMVATIVASATGSLVAGALTDPSNALCTLVTSYVILGIGFILALILLTILFARWLIHGLPPRHAVVAALITQGPLGSGSFAFMQLGIVSKSVFPKTHTLPSDTASPGDILFVSGWLIAIMIWGLSIAWLFFATAAMAKRRGWREFNMSWWALTFPLGVFALGTVMLGKETPSRFFRVFGTIFSVIVVVMWCVAAVGTVRMVILGKLPRDPSLKDGGEGKDTKIKPSGEKAA